MFGKVKAEIASISGRKTEDTIMLRLAGTTLHVTLHVRQVCGKTFFQEFESLRVSGSVKGGTQFEEIRTSIFVGAMAPEDPPPKRFKPGESQASKKCREDVLQLLFWNMEFQGVSFILKVV